MMSSSSTLTRPYEISDLAPETLSQIFKYLSTDERKAVKLVCQSWLHACNVFSLLDDELVICLGIYQLSDTYELLDRSTRGSLSLKFELVKFNNDSSFWEKNGSKIKSIDFVNCRFPCGTLRRIIIHCANLIHFSLKYTMNFSWNYLATEFPINDSDLDQVVEEGIVREKVKSLKIHVAEPDRIRISNHIVHQLFSIFPKVKILNLKYTYYSPPHEYVHRKIDLDLSQFSSKDCFTFSPVLKYLIAATDRLEKLKLQLCCNRFPMIDLSPTFTAMKRLKELSIHMGDYPLREDMNALFQCSKQLESLVMYMITVDPGSHLDQFCIHSLLLQTFLSNSSLKLLKIRSRDPPLIVSNSVFEKLKSSGLKRFSLDVESISVPDPHSFAHLLAENGPAALPNLSLSTFDLREDSLLFFVQNFQNLHHLELFDISDHILESLLKFKMKLKSWIICPCSSREWRIVSQDRFDVYRDAFNQLLDLEYLDLSFPVGDIFIRSLSPKPILANLKYLHIEVLSENQPAFAFDFLKAADAMPFLEGLKITNDVYQCVSFDFCFDLCRKLHRLRYFSYAGILIGEDGFCTHENYENYEKLFSICPSLQAFVLRFFGNTITYFYDTINKKVQLKRVSNDVGNDVVFRQPRVGSLSVKWLVL